MRVRVILPHPHLPELDYMSDLDLEVGDIVTVPLRNKEIPAIVCAINVDGKFKNLRSVVAKVEMKVTPKIIDFIFKAAKYYMVEVGSIVKLMLPAPLQGGRASKEISQSIQNIKLPDLSEDQLSALNEIKTHANPSVLKGITGSGKTEVYFHLIADVLASGAQALLMLPEIALSAQIIERFRARFCFKPAIWNSKVTKAKKRDLLRGIINGEVKVVIGTRSSLFLPYKNLGIIVVDEEHDASYKQEDNVLYNARDMAVMRSAMVGGKVVLASATPSIETLYNSRIGKYDLVNLHSRFGEAVLPDVEIVDMRTQKLEKGAWISPVLRRAIKRSLESQQQSMIFLNRRGYAPMVLCRSCGHKVTCNACSAWLVMHKAKQKLECHHCGYSQDMVTDCIECGELDSIISCGPGVERIAEEVARIFPEAKIQLITKEEMKSESEIDAVLAKIQNHEVDILIGTQIITKGYHFPKLNLVGVVDSDVGFSGGDLRAAERSFQLLYQVSGRAGRENTKGKVLMQTFSPENAVIEFLKDHEFEKFIEYELDTRVSSNMPPVTKMAAMLISGPDESKIMIEAKKIVRISPRADKVRILGPVPALLSKLQNKYRYRILIIADRKIDIQSYISTWLSNYRLPGAMTMKVDIDPYNLS
ncbi:MAG: primosomal protein N' [Rickettsiaceae bacterium]|nr:primosomal protein N' [Rickettsiaceae bacterium]